MKEKEQKSVAQMFDLLMQGSTLYKYRRAGGKNEWVLDSSGMLLVLPGSATSSSRRPQPSESDSYNID